MVSWISLVLDDPDTLVSPLVLEWPASLVAVPVSSVLPRCDCYYSLLHTAGSRIGEAGGPLADELAGYRVTLARVFSKDASNRY